MLKIIAAVSMLIDHIGVIFYPENMDYRIIGRMAFPIFAFMIAEGCRYTRHKLRYFLTVFGVGLICQLFYYHSGEICVLVTFSFSILCIYSLQNFKKIFFDHNSTNAERTLSMGAFIGCIGLTYIANKLCVMDYGFWGCMAPVFASLLYVPENCENTVLKKLDCIPLNVMLMSIAMLMIAANGRAEQYYSFFALIPLLLYSGKRGSLNMKYFFYIFYPLHLILLEGLNILINL